jgi:hypothetical protein
MAELPFTEEDVQRYAQLIAIRPEICDWLRANGIAPADVPVSAVPQIADGQITTPIYLRNEKGWKYLDANREAAIEARTYPLVAEPPPALLAWLRREVPTK